MDPNLLNELADKLGVGVQMLWDTLIKQAMYTDS